MPNSNYEHDFFAWANEQAALLRSGDLARADVEHIAQEIESMGRTEKRELISRLRILLLHLLKWRFQPEGRSTSWRDSIEVQRMDLVEHLEDNPSLKPLLGEAIANAYKKAIIDAARETSSPRATFPAACPWTFEQMMDEDYWPS